MHKFFSMYVLCQYYYFMFSNVWTIYLNSNTRIEIERKYPRSEFIDVILSKNLFNFLTVPITIFDPKAKIYDKSSIILNHKQYVCDTNIYKEYHPIVLLFTICSVMVCMWVH